jgi:hypothetical protein
MSICEMLSRVEAIEDRQAYEEWLGALDENAGPPVPPVDEINLMLCESASE